MSEKQSKRRRYNQRLPYLTAFEAWVSRKPPFFRFIKFRRWKREAPDIERFLSD